MDGLSNLAGAHTADELPSAALLEGPFAKRLALFVRYQPISPWQVRPHAAAAVRHGWHGLARRRRSPGSRPVISRPGSLLILQMRAVKLAGWDEPTVANWARC
jgi:hypothetical protein